MDEGLRIRLRGDVSPGIRGRIPCVRFDENDILSAGFGEAPLIGLLWPGPAGKTRRKNGQGYDARVK